jgi:hypothetical protein
MIANLQQALRRKLKLKRIKLSVQCRTSRLWPVGCHIIQGDQKVSVHLMITIQKVTSNVQSVPRQSPDIIDTRNRDTRLTLTPSLIQNSDYVIMVSD